jgi:PAS domain S-box-containing protein
VSFALCGAERKIFETFRSLESPSVMMLGIDNLAAPGVAPCLARTAVEPEAFIKLAEASPAMIWMADLDGLCTFANRSWLDFRGRTLGQERGHGWAEGIHPEDAHASLRAYWSACNEQRPFRTQYRVLCQESVYQGIERLGCPWRGEAGEPRGFVGCFTVLPLDSERVREAQEQLFQLSGRERQVLELIGLGFSTKQVAGRLGISYKTADSHRTHVLKKLGLHETASLVRFAIRARLITA